MSPRIQVGASVSVRPQCKAISSQVSMKGNTQGTTGHIFTLNSLYRTFRDRDNKSSPGSPEAFFCSALGLPSPTPSQNRHCTYLREPQLVQGSKIRSRLAAAESSSLQGIAISEKLMLINMWERQEGPGIMKDCIKVSLGEPRVERNLILRGPDQNLHCTGLFPSPCSAGQYHPLLLFCWLQHVPS